MTSLNKWADNSEQFAGHYSTNTIVFVYVCLVTATAILLHSALINKLKLSTIRFYTDSSCCSTIVASIVLLIDKANPNKINNAFLIDFCVYGILGTAIQLCDNYMTFSRYLVVYPKTTRTFKILANSYIWILLVFIYLPYVTILPIFVDTNNKLLRTLNEVTSGYIFMTAYLAYNLYFSYFFWLATTKENTLGATDKRMIFLGVKNITHIIISSVGAILQGLELTFDFAPGGCFSSFFTVNIALHFLFNWKIENSAFAKKLKFLPEIESHSSHGVNGRSKRLLSPKVSSSPVTGSRPSMSLHGISRVHSRGDKEPRIPQSSISYKSSGEYLQTYLITSSKYSNKHIVPVNGLTSNSRDCSFDTNVNRSFYNGDVEIFRSSK